jgi:hypothetical protein
MKNIGIQQRFEPQLLVISNEYGDENEILLIQRAYIHTGDE